MKDNSAVQLRCFLNIGIHNNSMNNESSCTLSAIFFDLVQWNLGIKSPL